MPRQGLRKACRLFRFRAFWIAARCARVRSPPGVGRAPAQSTTTRKLLPVPIARFIVAHAAAIMVLGVLAGIVFQPLAAATRPFLVALLMTTLSLAVMRTDLSTLGSVLRRPLASIAHVAWLLVLSPLAMYGALLLLPVPEGLRGPLVLYAATPPITSMPAFAILFSLDATFVLIGVALSALLSPLTVPAVASLVMGDQLTISAIQLAIRLALMIGGSFVIGLALRRFFGAERIVGWSSGLDAVFVIVATLIGIAVMDGVVALAQAHPHAMAINVVTVFATSLAQVVLATLLFLPAGLPTALGAGLNSGPRNMGIVLGVLGAAASDEVVMVVAAAQLPIYIFPLFQRPLIRRLMRRQRTAEGKSAGA